MGLVRNVLRWVAIVLVALSAAFNLMGGIGTSCVAIAPLRYGPSMALIAPYRWLYVGFMVAGVASACYQFAGLAGLIRRSARGVRHTFSSLVAAVAVAGAHTLASQLIRGSSAPANMRLALTAIALAAFVGGRLLGAFEPTTSADGDAREPGASGGGSVVAESVGAGLSVMAVFLTVHLLVAPTHTIAGVNQGDIWHDALLAYGVLAAIAGAAPWTLRALRTGRARRRSAGAVA